jgi:hypothetical protein
MGKKTDQFTKELTSLAADCALSIATIFDVSKSMAPISEAMKKCEKVMTDRHEHFFPGGHQTSEAELAIEQDAQYKQAAAASDALATKFLPLLGRQNDAKSELKKGLIALKKKVDEFDAYVKAKEKKWFGGKKSVPAAKASILAAKKYYNDCRGLTT